MQEWVTVIIVLLILAILLDGVRRMRINQRDKIRMSRSINKQGGGSDSGKDYSSELPNGGARIVGYREVPQTSTPRPPRKPAIPTNSSREQRKAPEQTRLNLDESVPLLMESVTEDVLMRDQQAEQEAIAQTRLDNLRMSDKQRIEPTFSALDDDDSYAASSRSSQPADDGYDYADEHGEDDDITYRESDYDDDEYADEAYSEDDHEDFADDYEDDDGEDYDDDYDDEEYDEAGAEPAPTSNTDQPLKEPEEVLIINVMAMKGEMFKGTALLDIILKCGMRYGDMNIFHRYSDNKGEGALLFSMANMVKPGTFDLDAMDTFETPGISLFMTLP